MTNHDQIQQGKSFSKSRAIRRFTRWSRSGWVAIGYLVLLGIAEYLVAFNAPQYGLPLHGLLLTALLWQSSLVNNINQRRFFLTLSLAPLIRLISLLMPLKLFPIIDWYLITAVPLFITAFLIARAVGINRRMAGLVVRAIPLQLLVSLSGFILGYIEYVILRPAPLVSALRWELIWLPALILFIFTGFLEELIFRGLLQYSARPQLGRFAIPYVAAVFAVLHLGYRSVLDFIFVFGVAVFFGYIVKRSGSILGVSVAHGLINIMLFLIFPFLLMETAPSQGHDTSLVIHEPTPVYAPAIPSEHSTEPVQGAPTVLPATSPIYLTPSSTPQLNLNLPIVLDDCSKAPPTQLKIGQNVEVSIDLNFRRDPGMENAILGSTLRGNRLKIIGGPVCTLFGGGMFRWWNVELSNGMTGWSIEGSPIGTYYFMHSLP